MDNTKDKLLQRRSKLSSTQRSLLEKRLRGEVDFQLEVISKRSQISPVPLSFAQQRLWFLHQLDPDNPYYSELACVQLLGALNVDALEKSFNEIVQRHEALRTTFEIVEEQAVQVIHPDVTVKLPVVKLDLMPEVEQQAQIEQLTTEIAQKPFDLTTVPLLRSVLLQIDVEEYLLVFAIHHIVVDGWSIGVLIRELVVLYEAFSINKTSPLLELPIQYADFAIWQRQWLQGELQKTQLDYWKQQLAGAATLALPTDRPRPPVQSFRGAVASFELSASLTDMLRDLSNAEGVTLFMTLLAAFQALLYRYTGQEDICVGSPVANRNQGQIQGLIGFFVNTLVLRTDLGGNPSFLELLNRVRQVCVGTYAHADIPFEQLVEELQPDRNLSRMPLFQVMFAWQEDSRKQLTLPDVTLNWLPTHTQAARFDLTLHIVDASELRGLLEYNTDLFDAETITRIVEHFRTLLEGIVANPQARLSDLPILTTDELNQQLLEWNDTAVEYPQQLCIHQLFEAQVERTPDVVAVVFEDEQLTYWELNTRANQLAHYLQQLGVKPEVLVGICVERSLSMVIGLLAILKAGGAYIPLDPGYPQERLAYMLEDSQPGVLLTQQYLLKNIPNHQAQVICIDSDWEKIATESTENPISNITFDNLAYVIYTSGSTGKPKGVLGLHRGAINRFQWMWQNYPFVEEEICCQKTSLNFVDSVWEIFGPLLKGITIVIVPDIVVKDAQHFARSLAHSNVTRLVLVPSLLRILLNIYDVLQLQLPNLKLWISSGEVLSHDLLVQFRQGLPNSTLLNLYGSSEVSADVTCYSITPQTVLSPSALIGRPIANTQIYILDAQNQPVPVGVIGELCIGGEGLARGYFQRPDLTAEKFIPDPFSDKLAYLYRTGDLARYLPSGDIEYTSRIDNQVKVRGFRIELGEIEAIISQHPGIREGVVTVHCSQVDSQRIVAYVVLQKEQAPTIPELRGFVEAKLPSYMVPSAFVTLEALPLTPNGKVDRKALPAPELTQISSSNIVSPSTPIENLLASIWAEILGIDQVGIHNNFFELGGHSLIATRVISQIRQVFQAELPLRYLFEKPTIAGLAKEIEKLIKVDSTVEVTNIEQVERTQPLPLSFAQQRLWFLAQLEPDSPFYNIPAAVRLQGQLNVEALEQSFNEIISRHEALRTNFQIRGEQAVAVTSEEKFLTLSIFDISDLSANQKEVEIKQQTLQEAQTPFDLNSDLLLRVKLLRLDEQEHIILLTMHHIVSDGWSIGVLVEELATLYQAFCHGQPSPLPAIPIQYGDFAIWQQKYLQEKVLRLQKTYWKQQLGGSLAVLQLPTDYPRPAVQSYKGKKYCFTVSKSLTTALKTLSLQAEATLFMTLLAAFKTLIYRYINQDDIIIGTAIANRNLPQIEKLIGFFVNTLVLRTDVSSNPSFLELLRRVKEVTLDAYNHQDLPFDQLVEEIQPERNLSHNPLFQVWFALDNSPKPSLKIEGLTLTTLEVDTGTAQFELSLDMVEQQEELIGTLEYNSDLFDADTIARLAEHFQTLLAGIVANPDRCLSELPILTETQKYQLQVEFCQNQSQIVKPQTQRCLHHLFEEQVKQTPFTIAVVCGTEQLSYQELNQLANQIAHYLLIQGLQPEQLVGLYLEKSPWAIAAILGILKAGGAYLPLDPTYPQERLALMLENAQISLLITQEQLLTKLPSYPLQIVFLDTDWQNIARESTENPICQVSADNLAYVLYTSGSTGQPKGVCCHHRSVTNLLADIESRRSLKVGTRCSLWTNLTFDVSVYEIFSALLRGGMLHIVPEDIRVDAIALMEWLSDRQIQSAFLPPFSLNALGDWVARTPENCCLQRLLVGVEPISEQMLVSISRSIPRLQIINGYGPTEATICTTLYNVQSESFCDRNTPIGRPVQNTEIYILDNYLQIVPVGIPGEIYISGVGLAQGYLHQPDLTKEKFILWNGSKRLYKTGDKAKYLADGNIEFIGRLDYQIKLRGFRIELGEIEATIKQHPCVNEAIVIVRKDIPGDQRLVAYFVENCQPQQSNKPQLKTDVEDEYLSQLENIYDQFYSWEFSPLDPSINLRVWTSHYTNQPLPEVEILECVRNTVERVLALQPSHILEIGCGTGLLLLRIAPHCQHYCGLDISDVALNYLQQQIDVKPEIAEKVTLLQGMAHELSAIEPYKFDTVILNEIIQNFPSINYLAQVLTNLVEVVKPGGRIFVGGIRSLPLLKTFHTWVQLRQAPGELSIAEFRQRVQESLQIDNELVIDPAFFYALQQCLPKMSHVQIQLKGGCHHNELTKFKYDVIIYVDTEINQPTNMSWLDWQKQRLTINKIRTLLIEQKPEILGIKGIPNARLIAEVKLLELLSIDENFHTITTLRKALLLSKTDSVDPEELWVLGNELPYFVNISWSNSGVDGDYDVVFVRNSDVQISRTAIPCLTSESINIKSWNHYANAPLQKNQQRQLAIELREFLEQKLPDYMIPAAFVALETLPLTPNGKVDRKALPEPDTVRPELEVVYHAPQTEIEKTIADIWQKLLKFEDIGIHDNFFELGGNSLLLAQVHSNLRKVLKRDLSLIDLFRYPTINSLVNYFNQVENQQPSDDIMADMTEKIADRKGQQRKRLQKRKSVGNM